MIVPDWFKRLFGIKATAPKQEVELAYSDYLRTKYGINEVFAKDDK